MTCTGHHIAICDMMRTFESERWVRTIDWQRFKFASVIAARMVLRDLGRGETVSMHEKYDYPEIRPL
jgi:hypothetical protein